MAEEPAGLIADESGNLLFDELTIGAPTSAKEVLRSGIISIETIKALRAINPSRSLLDVSGTMVGVLAVPVLYALLPHPITFVVCLLLVIRNFNCCAQLVHESDHGTLFPTLAANMRVGNFCASVLGYQRSGHRQAHMDHHLYLNTERDPDIIFSQPDASAREILMSLARDLTGFSAVQRFLQYSQPVSTGRKAFSVFPWRKFTPWALAGMTLAMWPVLITQAVLFVLYALTAGPQFYFWLHVLPIMTLYPFQIRVRSIAEHSFDDNMARSLGEMEAAGQAPSLDDVWITRTSDLGWLEGFVVGPLGQNYHYEHHVFPSIPNYNLPTIHRMLLDAGVAVPPCKSYFGFVFRKLWGDLTGGGTRLAEAQPAAAQSR